MPNSNRICVVLTESHQVMHISNPVSFWCGTWLHIVDASFSYTPVIQKADGDFDIDLDNLDLHGLTNEDHQ